MQITTPRQWIESETYYLREFRWLDDPNAGFSFDLVNPTDPASEPATSPYPESAENLRKCLDGTHAVKDLGNVAYISRGYSVPAEGRCECGQLVSLDGFTCTCEGCGADYNSNGDRLAPRECWGEDTGESVSEILRIR